MKKFVYIGASALILFVSCSKESNQPENLIKDQQGSKVVSFTATVESPSNADETKASINVNNGSFAWADGDQIAVQLSDDTFKTFEYSSSTEEFSATLGDETIKDGGVAYYPASIAIDKTPGSVTLSASATASDAAKSFPMFASVSLGSGALAFKHLGGILVVTVDHVPADATKLVLTVPSVGINGTFEVATSGDNKVISASGEDSSETLTFTAGTYGTNETSFSIPVPVTTFSGGFTIDFKNASDETLYTKTTSKTTISVARASLKKMSSLTVPINVYINYTEPWVSEATPYAYAYEYNKGTEHKAWPGDQVNNQSEYHHGESVYHKVIENITIEDVKIIVHINYNNDDSGYPYGDLYRATTYIEDLKNDLYISVAPITSQTTSKVYFRNWSTNGWITKLAAGYTGDYGGAMITDDWPGTLLTDLPSEYINETSYPYITIDAKKWIWFKGVNNDGTAASPSNKYIEGKEDKNTFVILKDDDDSIALDFGVANITKD